MFMEEDEEANGRAVLAARLPARVVVGLNACDEFWFSLWEVHLGLGWTMAEGVNGVTN